MNTSFKRMVLEMFENSDTWIYGPNPSGEIGWKLHINIGEESIPKFIEAGWRLGLFDELEKNGIGWKIASKSLARELKYDEVQRGKNIVLYVPENLKNLIPKIITLVEKIIIEYRLTYGDPPKKDAPIGRVGCIGIRWSNFYGELVPVPREYRDSLKDWLQEDYIFMPKSYSRDDINYIPDAILRYHPIPPWKAKEFEELRRMVEKGEIGQNVSSITNYSKEKPSHSEEQPKYASRFDLMEKDREKHIGSIVAVNIDEDTYVPAKVLGFYSDDYVEVEYMEGPKKGVREKTHILTISRTPEEKLKRRSYTQNSSTREEKYVTPEEIKKTMEEIREGFSRWLREGGKGSPDYLKKDQELIGRYMISRDGYKVKIVDIGPDAVIVEFVEGPYKGSRWEVPNKDVDKYLANPSQFKEKYRRDYKLVFYFLPILLLAFTPSILGFFNPPKTGLLTASRSISVSVIFLILIVILIFVRSKKKI